MSAQMWPTHNHQIPAGTAPRIHPPIVPPNAHLTPPPGFWSRSRPQSRASQGRHRTPGATPAPQDFLPWFDTEGYATPHYLTEDGRLLTANPVGETPASLMKLLPPSPYSGPHLHYYVLQNPDAPFCPELLWDARFPPEMIKRVTSREQVVRLTPGELKESLTFPEVREAWIRIRVPGNDTLLNACYPVSLKQERTITLQDAFDAVYEHLQRPVTQEQAADFARKDAECWEKAQEAFRKRCSESPHIPIPSVEWRKGVKRVDLLKENVRFLSMVVRHYHHPGLTNMVWVINASFVPAYMVDPRLPRPRRR
ncbi:hypothetical protein C8Q70DRAFT_100280 [Cubamyces menziesii]|nr:hypothetical protein C8Q70DRAFT_100280 [Cubamyces menziesii]